MTTTIAKISNALQRNIDIINDYRKSYYDAGLALREIHDKEQYLESHKDFASFCSDQWGFSVRHCRRIMDSSIVNDDLKGPIGPITLKIDGKNTIILPENESQARAVADVADDARTRVLVWTEAVAAAKKDESGKPRVTAALVKKVAKKIKGTKKPRPKKPRKPAADQPAREAGEDPPEPEHTGPILDGMKGEVCTGLNSVFQSMSEYRGLQNEIGEMLTQINNLANGASGGRLDYQECQRLCQQLQAQLKFAAPHTECPKCRRKWDKKCPHCKGTGWVTKNEFSACASDADKIWLEKRK